MLFSLSSYKANLKVPSVTKQPQYNSTKVGVEYFEIESNKNGGNKNREMDRKTEEQKMKLFFSLSSSPRSHISLEDRPMTMKG